MGKRRERREERKVGVVMGDGRCEMDEWIGMEVCTQFWTRSKGERRLGGDIVLNVWRGKLSMRRGRG